MVRSARSAEKNRLDGSNRQLLEGLMMAGQVGPAATPDCNNAFLTNYQNCLEFIKREPFYPRCKIKLPARDRAPQNLCIERTSSIGPYNAFGTNFQGELDNAPYNPRRPMPIVSESEQKAIALYERGLDQYKREANKDPDEWRLRLKLQDECFSYRPQLELFKERFLVERPLPIGVCDRDLEALNRILDRMTPRIQDVRNKLQEAVSENYRSFRRHHPIDWDYNP